VGSCLCSAESTSVVAASVVGVLDVFTPEVEMEASPVRWGSVLGGLERLGGMVLSRRRVERVSDVRRGGIFDGPEHLGGGMLSRNCVERRGMSGEAVSDGGAGGGVGGGAGGEDVCGSVGEDDGGRDGDGGEGAGGEGVCESVGEDNGGRGDGGGEGADDFSKSLRLPWECLQ